MKKAKVLSIFLPLLVVAVGVFFIVFVIHEYRKNNALIDENQALIAGSAKTLLMNNLADSLPRDNLFTSGPRFSWIRHKPEVRWFNSGKQIFPWVREVDAETINKEFSWLSVWKSVNSFTESEVVNTERLKLLQAVNNALKNGDQQLISHSFDVFMMHKEAFILSPQEEIAFSLKLIDLGVETHWNNALIDAFLLTGGPQEKAITRPVIDWLFHYHQLFSVSEFNDILAMINTHLERVNLSAYYLDEYVQYFNEESHFLPVFDEGDLVLLDNKMLVQYFTNNVAVSKIVQLDVELEKVRQEFLQLGVFQDHDYLSFRELSNVQNLDSLQLQVHKEYLIQARDIQIRYLIVKMLILITFLGVLFLLLRMQNKHQQKQMEVVYLKEDFVKLVGHELKTPLSGIRAMAETLQKRTERNLATQSYPERIVNESDKLWHMVDNILNLNRMQGNFSLQLENIELKKLCHSVVKEVKSSSDKHYKIVNLIPNGVFYQLDVEIFSLVIKNILINASLYNVHACVLIEFSFVDNMLIIKDNGIGIEPENVERVFEPFVRLPQTISKSGTGIGLTLCRKIVVLHGATITINKSNSDGTFWAIKF